MHWHLAYCASISEAAFSYSPNGRHWDAEQLVHVLAELQGALVNWPPQAHLERDGEQLPVKLLMKRHGGASGIGEPGAFAVKLELTWSYW